MTRMRSELHKAPSARRRLDPNGIPLENRSLADAARAAIPQMVEIIAPDPARTAECRLAVETATEDLVNPRSFIKRGPTPRSNDSRDAAKRAASAMRTVEIAVKALDFEAASRLALWLRGRRTKDWQEMLRFFEQEASSSDIPSRHPKPGTDLRKQVAADHAVALMDMFNQKLTINRAGQGSALLRPTAALYGDPSAFRSMEHACRSAIKRRAKL